SPLREDQIFPGVLDAGRERAASQALETARPRFVLFCNRPTNEYGPVRFGTDYAVGLWGTVERLYQPAAFFAMAPPAGRGRRVFNRLFEPREANPPASASGNPAGAGRGSPAAPVAGRR